MAYVSVVGQHPGPHRLDSEPQLFVFKLARKKIPLPRKSSLEKMMFRRSSGTGDCGSVTTEATHAGSTAAPEKTLIHPVSPGRPGEAAVTGGGMPGEGCGALPAQAPRSAGRHREEGTDCVKRGTGESQKGQSGDWNSNVDCDSNQNTGGRRGTSSFKRTVIGAMPSASAANGHKRAHSHRDGPGGRRASQQGSNGGHQVVCARSLSREAGGPPLERLTQGRTGVVRLARTEPHRREAWSIFPQEQDPRVREEKGEGHRFDSKAVTQDWCDGCSRQITAQALKCQNCSYTCHLECEGRVQLDCNQKDKKPEETPSPRSHCSTAPQHKNEAKEEEEGGTKAWSEEEVRTRIEEYNAQVTENGMKLATDGAYTGFIKVHLRLSRPVTVPDVEAAASEGGSRQTDRHGQPVTSSGGQEGPDGGSSDRRTSFYLPSDCVKQLHISSATTASEVIKGLLKKFMVLDNPRKFALYRQTHRDGQDLFQKLPLSERPLSLRLIAGPDPEHLTFVLKENETGEVEWHAFSVPELHNFLVILGKEETERVRVVEHRYRAYRQRLQQALQRHDP